MKKTFYLGIIFFICIFLAGCSLIPQPKSKTSNKKIVMPDEDTNSPLDAKVVVGSIWKTIDGGHNFKSKSKKDPEFVAMIKAQEESKKNTKSEKKPDDGRNENSNGIIDNTVKTKAQTKEGDWISTADILSIAFHPQKQNILFVSTANDGLFKTENGGEFWKPIPFPPKNVYSFIIDASDPDNRMLASGVVGEWGKIFRTKDGGTNWEEVYTEPGEKVPITALAQHSKNFAIILAGTKNGTVIKSIDRGDTWKNVGQLEDYKDFKTGKTIVGKKITGNVSDFAFDSTNESIVYMVTYGNKLYYSRNIGDRWLDWEFEKNRELAKMKIDKVSSEKIKAFQERMKKEAMPRGIVSIVADPKISGTLYVGTTRGFFVSTSYGKWWKELNTIESARRFPIRSTAVNPKNSNEIVFVSGKAFYKSINSGKTWETVGLNVNRDAAFVAYDPFDSNILLLGLRQFGKK